MLRLYISNVKLVIRKREELFWGLLFPLILATLFYVTFGSGIDLEKMKAVPAALVSQGNEVFETFLENMEEGFLAVTEMDEDEALQALKAGEIDGIFYSGEEPSLTVAASQMNESILEMLLSSYVEHEALLRDIGKEHPLQLPAAIAQMADYREMTENVTVSGRSMETNVGYFYGLIGMACLFGAFMGMTAAEEMRADQSALALRRSVSPVHRLAIVLSGMLAVFTVQFISVCILLLYLRILGLSFGEKWYMLLPVCALGSMTGVAYGIFIGSMRLRNGLKIGILISSSLLMSFFAGMMFVNMKDIIEHHIPILNRINPASLIADAFYSVSIYDNPGRYGANLLLLAAITCLLAAVSFFRLRRERYESL